MLCGASRISRSSSAPAGEPPTALAGEAPAAVAAMANAAATSSRSITLVPHLKFQALSSIFSPFILIRSGNLTFGDLARRSLTTATPPSSFDHEKFPHVDSQ